MAGRISPVRLARWLLLVFFCVFSAVALLRPPAEPMTGTWVQEQRENVIITRFVDENGQPQLVPESHYCAVMRTYDTQNRLVQEVFLDTADRPVMLSERYTGILYRYEQDDVWLTYVDAQENPVLTSGGYAYVRRVYEDGRCVGEYYYDLAQKPTACIHQYHGIRWEYDENGQRQRAIYVDTANYPVTSGAGYAIILFDTQNGSFRERYFDIHGDPAASYLGQYGVSYTYDAQGQLLQTDYLGKDGGVAPTKYHYASIRCEYNAAGYAQWYLDAAGKPVALEKGQYGVQMQRQCQYLLDQAGQPLWCLDNLFVFVPYVVVLVGMLLCVLFALLPKPFSAVLLAAYVLFVFYQTLLFRETRELQVNLHLFSYLSGFFTAYGLRAEAINNIWLLLPFGAGLAALHNRRWVLLLPFALSLLIETTQLLTNLGTFEYNDLFGNTLGGLIGYWAVCEIRLFKKEYGKERT